MRDDQVPDHRLESLGMRGDVLGIDRRNDDAGIGDLRGETALPPFGLMTYLRFRRVD